MSNENVSLPVAEALASALAKIEAYVPTEYVDNSEPDIDAEHLNHAEQGIMRVTNLLNAAVDVIQDQESRLADAETKIGTAALTGGMTDLSSGLNALNSNMSTKFGYITDGADLSIIQKGIHFYNGWASASMINGVAPFSNRNGIWIRSIPYDSIASDVLDVVIAEDGTIYTSKDKGNTWSSK